MRDLSCTHVFDLNALLALCALPTALACCAHSRHAPPPHPGFEMTYNGHVIHSKLKTGSFPDPATVIDKLRSVMDTERGTSAQAAASA